MDIDGIITSLQSLTKEDLRFVSEEGDIIKKLIAMPLQELFEECDQDYNKYLTLRIQLAKIFVYDNFYKNYDNALSTINNLLQIVTLNTEYTSYLYDLLYLKAVLFHHHYEEDKANDAAKVLYEECYKDSSNQKKASIHKLLAITSKDIQVVISQFNAAIELFNPEEKSQIGFIHKNLSFAYLEYRDLNNSLQHLMKFLQLAAFIDMPPNYDFLTLSSYLEVLKDEKILDKSKFEKLRRYLKKFTEMAFENEETWIESKKHEILYDSILKLVID